MRGFVELTATSSHRVPLSKLKAWLESKPWRGKPKRQIEGYLLRQMPFQIPKDDIEAVRTLKSMASATVGAFIAALKTVPLTADTDEIAKRIADEVPPLTPKQLAAVLDALYGFYFIRIPRPIDRQLRLE